MRTIKSSFSNYKIEIILNTIFDRFDLRELCFDITKESFVDYNDINSIVFDYDDRNGIEFKYLREGCVIFETKDIGYSQRQKIQLLEELFKIKITL